MSWHRLVCRVVGHDWAPVPVRPTEASRWTIYCYRCRKAREL